MDERETKIFELVDRALSLFDKWIDRKYPEQKEEHGELWKKGDPIPEPKNIEEYREFPGNQPGRFERTIQEARRARHEDS